MLMVLSQSLSQRRAVNYLDSGPSVTFISLSISPLLCSTAPFRLILALVSLAYLLVVLPFFRRTSLPAHRPRDATRRDDDGDARRTLHPVAARLGARAGAPVRGGRARRAAARLRLGARRAPPRQQQLPPRSPARRRRHHRRAPDVAVRHRRGGGGAARGGRRPTAAPPVLVLARRAPHGRRRPRRAHRVGRALPRARARPARGRARAVGRRVPGRADRAELARRARTSERGRRKRRHVGRRRRFCRPRPRQRLRRGLGRRGGTAFGDCRRCWRRSATTTAIAGVLHRRRDCGGRKATTPIVMEIARARSTLTVVHGEVLLIRRLVYCAAASC